MTLLRGAASATALTCLTLDASAADWREAHPYAAIGATHDSNPLRLSDSEDPLTILGEPETADTYSTIEAGFDADVDVSRQKFALSGRAFRDSFDRFSAIDYTGGDARAVWSWNQGRPWSGDVGYVYGNSLRDFANQDIPTRDIRTENRRLLAVTRALGNGLQIQLRGSSADVVYDVTEGLDVERQTTALGVSHRSRADNSVGVEFERAVGDYKFAPLRNYEEQRLQANLDLKIGGHTQVTVQAGYTSRDNDDPLRADYSGVTGRVTMSKTNAADNKLETSVWRDVNSLGDEIADYAVVQGISVTPSWHVARRATLHVDASYEHRDFKGESGTTLPPPTEDTRQDNVLALQTGVTLSVFRHGTVSIDYTVLSRDSNRDLDQYDSRGLALQLRIGLD